MIWMIVMMAAVLCSAAYSLNALFPIRETMKDRTPIGFVLLMQNTAALFEYAALVLALAAAASCCVSNHAVQSFAILWTESSLLIVMLRRIKDPGRQLVLQPFEIAVHDKEEAYARSFKVPFFMGHNPYQAAAVSAETLRFEAARYSAARHGKLERRTAA